MTRAASCFVRRIVVAKLLGMAALMTSGCVAPKFLINIPANSTPQREARYYRGHDAAYFVGGVALDQALRIVWHGPQDHTGMGDRQVARCLEYATTTPTLTATPACVRWGWTDSVQAYTFRWRSGTDAPVYRVATVVAVGMIDRQTDKGYRESGALMIALGALLNEWTHAFVAAIRGRF